MLEKTLEYIKNIIEIPENMETKPYVLRLKKDDREIVLIGTEHTKDPDDPQIDYIKEATKNFLTKRLKDKPIFIIDGNLESEHYDQKCLVDFGKTNKVRTISIDKDVKEYFEESEKSGTDVNLVREKYLFKEVIKLWEEGFNVLGVFGFNHVMAQEEAYKYLDFKIET